MRIGPELNGARLTVVRTAELLPMDPGHFRRLVRRGVLPSPRRNAKGKPYYDYPLLVEIAEVLKASVGKNGEEVAFYRRKQRHRRPRVNGKHESKPRADEYIAAIVEGCKQLGIVDADLAPAKIAALLSAEFRGGQPPLEQAIPAIARRLLEGQG
jgi:hypothetical protein